MCVGYGNGSAEVTDSRWKPSSVGWDTYIIDTQQTIAGLDATRLIDGAMKSHVCYDQRIIGTAPQR